MCVLGDAMSVETMISAAAGVILGGLITWVTAWYYYKKAGDQLLDESRKLKQTSDLILYKLQYPNAQTQLKRNQNGEVVGLTVEMSANL
jgi:hypothetical protein